MSRRRVASSIARASAVSVAVMISTLVVLGSTATSITAADGDRGHPVAGSTGTVRTTAQLVAAASGHPTRVHPPLPLRRSPAKTANPDAVPTLRASRSVSGPAVAVTDVATFDGPSLEPANPAFPPDTQGDIGPTQFVVTLNSRFRSYSRSGVPDGALDLAPEDFFATEMTPLSVTVTCNVASDPHIRYDRLSQRWFVVMIDVPNCEGTLANRIMIAVSEGATLTPTTEWTFFHINAPALTFVDYPTLGIDANALYIGTNNFSVAGLYTGSDGYVVRKASVLGGGPVIYSRFQNLAMFTPQGVDDPYNADTAGYFVGVDASLFGKVDLIRVSDPGGSPAITTRSVTVPATATPLPVPHLGNTGGNNGRLDGLDDRLLAGTMTADGHIWTGHGIAVNASGVSSNPLNRNGARWYELGNVATTPTLVQSGTVFDGGSNPDFYWMPTVAVSGQGIMAVGGTTAGSLSHADAWYAARLLTDPPGSTEAPTRYTGSTFAYNPPGDDGSISGSRRWGDYSLTRVDPEDNQTIWTIQEYVSATNTWGVKVARLRAPGPATPSGTSGSVQVGSTSAAVTLTGTSVNGSGWYDPGTGFPQRLQVSTGCGAVVRSVTFSSPTSLGLVLDTTTATAGTCSVTTTNPDGQATSGAVLQVSPAPVASIFQPDGLVERAGTTYRGDGVYNTTGAHQTAAAKSRRHTKQRFSLVFQNDGTAPDAFRLTGTGTRPGFRVRYFRGTTNVTSEILAGSFVTPTMAPGASTALRMVVTVTRGARVGARRSWLVTAASTGRQTSIDAVRAKVRVVR